MDRLKVNPKSSQNPAVNAEAIAQDTSGIDCPIEIRIVVGLDTAYLARFLLQTQFCGNRTKYRDARNFKPVCTENVRQSNFNQNSCALYTAPGRIFEGFGCRFPHFGHVHCLASAFDDKLKDVWMSAFEAGLLVHFMLAGDGVR